MNAERLQALVSQLAKEVEMLKVSALLHAIHGAMTQLRANPDSEQAKDNYAMAVKAAHDVLREAPSNFLPRSQRRMMDSLQLSAFFGEGLLQTMRSIVDRSEFTSRTLEAAFRDLMEEVSRKAESVQAISGAFDTLGLEVEELDEASGELAITIPRRWVKEDLREFGKECADLAKALQVFTELGTEKRQPIKLRTIASSDYVIYIGMVVGGLQICGAVIKWLLEAYKTVLDIRCSRETLAASQLPPEVLEKIDAHLDSRLEDAIGSITERAVAAAKVDIAVRDGRINELKIEAGTSVRFLARRIKAGFQFDLHLPDSSARSSSGSGLGDSLSQTLPGEIDKLSDALNVSRGDGEGTLLSAAVDAGPPSGDEEPEISSDPE